MEIAFVLSVFDIGGNFPPTLVTPGIFQEGKGNTQQYFIQALQDLLTKGLVEREDAVCYLSGSFGEGFGTTFLEVNQVNKILESRKQYLLPNF